MILTVPLQPGTLLANVRYRWIALGAIGAEENAGITQPWATVPTFRIDDTPPADAEELIVYDSTDATNWNVGGYASAAVRDGILGAAQVILTSLYSPSAGPGIIVPAQPASLSICRTYGTFVDLGNASADGVPVLFTLVAVDDVDPTIIYDLSATPLVNTETGLIIASRTISANLVAGQIQDVNANNYVDLVRNDYMQAAGQITLPAASSLKYLLQCDALGAPLGIGNIALASASVFSPILFRLDTSSIGQTTSGTYDLSKKAAA